MRYPFAPVLFALVAALWLVAAGGRTFASDGAPEGPGGKAGEHVPGLEAALLDAYAQSQSKWCPGPNDASAVRYSVAQVDLSQDGKDEIVVFWMNGVPGSGGASALVLGGADQEFREIAFITQVFAPIRVAPRRDSGWRDLIVHVSGGGGEPGERLLAYGDSGYPSNASDAPLADPEVIQAAGDPIISAEEGTWNAARLLVPEGCSGNQPANEGIGDAARSLAPEGCEPNVVLGTESLGKVKVHDDDKKVRRRFRKPLKGPEPEEGDKWTVDDRYRWEWRHPEVDATVVLVGRTKKGPWSVETIIVEAPSPLTTGNEIGIGASIDQVTGAYGCATVETDEAERVSRILVGNEYEGLFFDLDEQGKVERITLGAAEAE